MKVRITPLEMLAYSLGRELRDGEIAFVGQGHPIVAACLAKKFFAPRLKILMEGGIYGSEPYRPPWHIADLTATRGCLMLTDFAGVFLATLSRGFVDVGILGCSQVDKYGNINTTVVGDYFNPVLRLPGSGGAHEVGSFSKRLIITMAGGRFMEKLDYVTTPGWLEGGDSRERAGLPGGPAALITKKAIFRFHPETKEMYLDARYPWVSVEEIKKEIPWELKLAEDGVKVAPLPSPEELRFIREFSPLTALRRDYYIVEKITEKHWMLEASDEPLLTRIVEIRDEEREAIRRRIAMKREARGSFFKKEIEKWKGGSAQG